MTVPGTKLAEAVGAILHKPADEPAFSFEGRWLPWGVLQSTARAIIDVLDKGGVNPRAPVAIIIRTRPGFFAALMGLITARRSVVMIHAYQSPQGLADEVRRKAPGAVICAARDWSPEVVAAAKEIGCVGVNIGDAVEGATAQPGLEKVAAHASPKLTDPEIVLLTSGTTGPPKGFPMSYDLVARAMLTDSTLTTAGMNVPPFFLFFPLGNISGLYSFMSIISAKNKAVMVEKFTIEAWADYVHEYKPAGIALPPAGVRMALDRKIPKEKLASLKYIQSGAAPLDPTAHRAFEKAYGIPILLSYGATEFGGPVTLMTPDLRAKFGDAKLESVGRAWADARLRIIDPDTGAELPPDTAGILEVSTPRIGSHWIRTTDLARIDTDGFIFHLGRADGAINRGGFKIMPDAVEKALATHPAIAAAAVVGLPDDRLGEVPGAAIQIKSGATAPSSDELTEYVRQRLPATHIPTMFQVVEALPRTSSLKTSTPGVRALLLEARGKNAG